MRAIILPALLIALLATGCATLPATVEVPVAVPCPAPEHAVRPRLSVGSLRPDSTPSEVVRAYAADLVAVIGYAEQLETILDGYRPEPGQ